MVGDDLTMEEALVDYPHLLKQWDDVNKTCLKHQCTPDYQMGQLHGELHTIQVCGRRNGTCHLDVS